MVLSDLLMEFYQFLEQKDKPTDEHVRETFITYNQRWKNYCSKHQLAKSASYLFNTKVSASWQKRYPNQTTPSQAVG